MAVPKILATSFLTESVDVTSRTLSFPTGTTTGSLIVGAAQVSGTASPSVPTGWNGEASSRRMFFTKYITGNEGSSVTITTATATKGNYLMMLFDVGTVLTYTDTLGSTNSINQNYRTFYTPIPTGSGIDFNAFTIYQGQGADTYNTSSNATSSVYLNTTATNTCILFAQNQELPLFKGTYTPNSVGNAIGGNPMVIKHLGVLYQPTSTQRLTYNTSDDRSNNSLESLSSTLTAIAQSFQSDGRTIKTVYFSFNRTNAAMTGSLTASIWTHTGSYNTVTSLPTGSRLAVSSTPLNIANINTDAGSFEDYIFDFNFTPTSGSYYWVGIEAPSITGTGTMNLVAGSSATATGRSAIFSGSAWLSRSTPLRFTLLTDLGVFLAGARRNLMVS